MFLITRPTRPQIDAFLSDAAADQLSYSEAGATLSASAPDGYANNDHNRVVIGNGPDDWERAKQAVRDWKMFDLGWCSICWPYTPIEKGGNVAMMACHMGFFSLNAARVVYTIDEAGRFGFAYGTLSDHVECGEERFSVEFDRASGEIWYDLYSFSRPRHPLARLGYPYARYLQRRFIADSKLAMVRAVRGRYDPRNAKTPEP
jgi:uncharacterized protein (UPF0548 family)